ncbi:MAG TPA: lysylphosphatidylglycerol synthase transmembrane domain-containing protein [Vicinamibacterales bacterium]|nr:lysylphosphatidylglycerol synthase transmembrane domain-containing protein [Vicinamibacterales bacterium]
MSRLLRLSVAVLLTALVLYWSHPSEIVSATARADWRWLLASLGLVFIDRTLMAMRWIDLLVALAPGSRPPLSAVLRVFFTSSFVSNFVPSVASDLYRAYALSRYDVHLAESTASVLMDRALGVLSVVLVAAVALPFAPAIAARGSMVATVILLFALCAVAACVVFSERAAAFVRSTARRIPLGVLHRVTDALTDAVRRYADHHREMVRVLALSIMVQIIRVLQAWCLGVALGIALPLSAYFVFIPIIVFIMQVPVSINGIGTTQAAFAWTFVPQGAPPAEVFALSMLFLALGIVGTLPGGLFYATDAGRGPGGSQGHGPHGSQGHGRHGSQGHGGHGRHGRHGRHGSQAGSQRHGPRGAHRTLQVPATQRPTPQDTCLGTLGIGRWELSQGEGRRGIHGD